MIDYTDFHTSTNMTKPNSELAKQIERTPPGMAFWSGTGPNGATCRGCANWNYGRKRRQDVDGNVDDARCGMYIKFMKRSGNYRVPAFNISSDTSACKYYEHSDKNLKKAKKNKVDQ